MNATVFNRGSDDAAVFNRSTDDATVFNRVVLQAQVVQRGAMRYTPAGLPALDVGLKHASEVTEAGLPRKVSLELRAVGIGHVAEQVGKLAVGDTAGFAGFLGAGRNGKGVLLHITELHIIELPSSDTAAADVVSQPAPAPAL